MDLLPRKMMLASTSTSPAPLDSPRSPLHLSQYGLPSSSRLPKVMIAAVAGFALLTVAAYYFCKWIFGKKSRRAAVAASTDPEAPSAPAPDAIGELQARVAKSLAQRLGSKIISSIPTVSYAELKEFRAKNGTGGAAGVESEACAVCLTEFSKNPPGTKIKLLPKCAHAFHSSCIDLWLVTQASCPICRASLFVALAELNLIRWTRGGEAREACPPAATPAVAEAEPDRDRV